MNPKTLLKVLNGDGEITDLINEKSIRKHEIESVETTTKENSLSNINSMTTDQARILGHELDIKTIDGLLNSDIENISTELNIEKHIVKEWFEDAKVIYNEL